MFRVLKEAGEYITLMRKVFARPEKISIFHRKLFFEMESIGYDSVAIVALISLFMGAGLVIQMVTNLENPMLPKSLIGYAPRESIILEFSSTIVALILAGKVGSNIASEIGTMRITEQIDALEIMGVNSASFLILPKMVAAMVMLPILTAMSMLVGVFGGYLITVATDILPPYQYIIGIKQDVNLYYIFYSLIKAFVFGFLITTISSYYGYFAKGSSLEVGRSSTRAVVMSSIMILVFNLIITQLMLT
ncbi:MAG: ABC transporter permease [Mucinivorans sp.]